MLPDSQSLSIGNTSKFFLQRSRLNDSFYGDYWIWLAVTNPSAYNNEANVYENLENLATAGRLTGTDVGGHTFPVSDDPAHPLPSQHHPPI